MILLPVLKPIGQLLGVTVRTLLSYYLLCGQRTILVHPEQALCSLGGERRKGGVGRMESSKEGAQWKVTVI